MNAPDLLKPHIGDLTLDELREALAGLGEPGYRAAQVFDWLYHKHADNFEAMSNLPKAFRGKLAGAFRIGGLELFAIARSKDGTEKRLFRLDFDCANCRMTLRLGK